MWDRQNSTPFFDSASPRLTAFSKYGSALRYLPSDANDAPLLHHPQANVGSSSSARSLQSRASWYFFRSASDTPLLYQARSPGHSPGSLPRAASIRAESFLFAATTTDYRARAPAPFRSETTPPQIFPTRKVFRKALGSRRDPPAGKPR